MSDTKPIDDGGPAFPTEVCGTAEPQNWHQTGPNSMHCHGLSIRDYFAAKALVGLMTAYPDADCGANGYAQDAYLYADAMLLARAK